ncbi:hypothetical protein BDV93DRAFT_565756 [Ceratobasidium sp. AG-I]|nr:hypothetical protein BDV93DRAFT_565756 [Ceratobasidium sp. AG-I]
MAQTEPTRAIRVGQNTGIDPGVVPPFSARGAFAPCPTNPPGAFTTPRPGRPPTRLASPRLLSSILGLSRRSRERSRRAPHEPTPTEPTRTIRVGRDAGIAAGVASTLANVSSRCSTSYALPVRSSHAQARPCSFLEPTEPVPHARGGVAATTRLCCRPACSRFDTTPCRPYTPRPFDSCPGRLPLTL